MLVFRGFMAIRKVSDIQKLQFFEYSYELLNKAKN